MSAWFKAYMKAPAKQQATLPALFEHVLMQNFPRPLHLCGQCGSRHSWPPHQHQLRTPSVELRAVSSILSAWAKHSTESHGQYRALPAYLLVAACSDFRSASFLGLLCHKH